MKTTVACAFWALGLIALATGGGRAADLADDYAVAYCAAGANSSLSDTGSDAELTENVVRLMDEAVAVSHDPRWVSSSRPAFVWATEAKAACGKAYGYLKYSVRDDQTLRNCGCFHHRMVSFMQ